MHTQKQLIQRNLSTEQIFCHFCWRNFRNQLSESYSCLKQDIIYRHDNIYIMPSSLLLGSIGRQPWTFTWLYFWQLASPLSKWCFLSELVLHTWSSGLLWAASSSGPLRFHSRAERVLLFSGFRNVCPIHFHFVVSFPRIVLHLNVFRHV